MRILLFSFLCLAFHVESAAATQVITSIPTGGYPITTPGTYVLGNNVTWSPTNDGQAILITSSDVTLDLQGYILDSITTQFNTIGITAIGVSNLTIKNGVVANMALGGVKCSGCENIVIDRVVVDGLNMQNTGVYTVPFGILVDASTGATINKCKVKNVDVTTGSLAGIQLTSTSYSKVSKCLVTDMINRDGACTGIGHLLCEGAAVESCKIDNLRTEFVNNLNTEGHTAIGIVPVLSAGLSIRDCSVSNIVGCCDDAHGMSIFECVGALVDGCKVENVLDGAGAAQTGAKATGIEVYASGVEVSNCKVKNIVAINPQDKQATGFSCAQCLGVKFIRCHAENVSVVDENGVQDPSLGYGTGFGWAPDPRPEFIFPAVGVLYKHCTAKKCQVGFDSWYHIDSLWRYIYSDCNDIPILDDSNSQRTISCDACSECGCLQTGCYPSPRTVTLDNIAQNNKFIHVRITECEEQGQR